MEAKKKLKAALQMVRADLREEFLEDLALRLATSLSSVCASGDFVAEVARMEYDECIAQALESVDVPRRCQSALVSMLEKGKGVQS